jgi:hypothetical protein
MEIEILCWMDLPLAEEVLRPAEEFIVTELHPRLTIALLKIIQPAHTVPGFNAIMPRRSLPIVLSAIILLTQLTMDMVVEFPAFLPPRPLPIVSSATISLIAMLR